MNEGHFSQLGNGLFVPKQIDERIAAQMSPGALRPGPQEVYAQQDLRNEYHGGSLRTEESNSPSTKAQNERLNDQDMLNPRNIIDLKAVIDRKVQIEKDDRKFKIDGRLDKDHAKEKLDIIEAKNILNQHVDKYTQTGVKKGEHRDIPESLRNDITRLVGLSYEELEARISKLETPNVVTKHTFTDIHTEEPVPVAEAVNPTVDPIPVAEVENLSEEPDPTLEVETIIEDQVSTETSLSFSKGVKKAFRNAKLGLAALQTNFYTSAHTSKIYAQTIKSAKAAHEYFYDEEYGKRRKIIGGVIGLLAVGAAGYGLYHLGHHSNHSNVAHHAGKPAGLAKPNTHTTTTTPNVSQSPMTTTPGNSVQSSNGHQPLPGSLSSKNTLSTNNTHQSLPGTLTKNNTHQSLSGTIASSNGHQPLPGTLSAHLINAVGETTSHSVIMHNGDTVWKIAQDHLMNTSHQHPSVADINLEMYRLLHLNNLTLQSAHHLIPGTEILV